MQTISRLLFASDSAASPAIQSASFANNIDSLRHNAIINSENKCISR